jgi:hypothetical protein
MPLTQYLGFSHSNSEIGITHYDGLIKSVLNEQQS